MYQSYLKTWHDKQLILSVTNMPQEINQLLIDVKVHHPKIILAETNLLVI